MNVTQQILVREIESHREEILRIAQHILQNPELGFQEEKTSRYVQETLAHYEIPYTTGHAITGVKAVLKGRESKYTVCLMGELDAVKCAGHPQADLSTGAAHACGHNIQIANMLGTAIALKKSGIMAQLGGDIVFMAVPAEEFIELAFREEMKKRNKIRYFSGKQQLIYEGAFDDVDMAVMLHSQANTQENQLFIGGSSLGFLAKTIHFSGKAAHASTPSKGINALNAAILALAAINANRETFEEKDKVRVHPIITNGGDIVNSVPGAATVETYVRAADITVIQTVNAVVDNCMKAGALAIGAQLEIKNQGAYLPLHQNEQLTEVLAQNAAELMPRQNIVRGVDMIGSTDAGDLSYLMPCIQPTIGGFFGAAHSTEFGTLDTEFNIITATKLLAFTLVDLLENNAQKAETVMKSFTPTFDKNTYLEYLNNV